MTVNTQHVNNNKTYVTTALKLAEWHLSSEKLKPECKPKARSRCSQRITTFISFRQTKPGLELLLLVTHSLYRDLHYGPHTYTMGLTPTIGPLGLCLSAENKNEINIGRSEHSVRYRRDEVIGSMSINREQEWNKHWPVRAQCEIPPWWGPFFLRTFLRFSSSLYASATFWSLTINCSMSSKHLFSTSYTCTHTHIRTCTHARTSRFWQPSEIVLFRFFLITLEAKVKESVYCVSVCLDNKFWVKWPPT